MKKAFEGLYYKHQKGSNTVSLIAGIAADHSFVQVITNDESYYFRYPLKAYSRGSILRVGGSVFSENGVEVNIESENNSIHGKIGYTGITPIRYDIMGPFKYLPMQCRHSIKSLYHRLNGSIVINGKAFDFTDGTGYIEGDAGKSFPKSYAWVQCNDFPKKACIVASVADIPFAGFSFRGCICIVYCHGAEYRLATYLGARIICCDEHRIIIRQGKLQLDIEIEAGKGHRLIAPEKGAMSREIRECIVSGALFRLTRGKETLFAQYSENASYEYVNPNI